MEAEVKQKIKKIVAEQTKVDESSIQDDTMLVEDLLVDSLCIIKIIVSIENEFDLEITDENLVIQDKVSFAKFCELMEPYFA